MKLTSELIRSAYQHHHNRYHVGRRQWNIDHHVDCWALGQAAFERDDREKFDKLYGYLRNVWKAFRPIKEGQWEAARIWQELGTCDRSLCGLTASRLTEEHVPALWHLLNHMGRMKPLRSGPSVVAVSKVLHFWNPRLFVVVDDAIVWQWVLAHRWLWDPIRRRRDAIAPLVPDAPAYSEARCDLLSYIAILLWAGELVRDNPDLVLDFAQHVGMYGGDGASALPVYEYEAAAVEWFMFGVVEIPPTGYS